MTDPVHPMATSPAVPAPAVSEAAGHPVPVTDPAPVTASATEADTAPAADPTTAAEVISSDRALLGIELGSTRIKAVLIDPAGTVLASGAHAWENRLIDGIWTYGLDEVVSGVQAAYAALAADVRERHATELTALAGLGVSAMMHGYLAFDADGELLVPFRTWRNTTTGSASAMLSEAFGRNIPLRWSVSHLLHAVLEGEEHVARIAHLNTLAGHVHELLSGQRVLGIGDASGMFPIDPATHDYDERLLDAFAGFDAVREVPWQLRELLPRPLVAGEAAGTLTADGAALLDPTGALRPGAVMAPPEGDAGTGMVATNSVRPRTGNVSAGTSAFAMVVLESDLPTPREEIDLVATPAGNAVAMIHTNNCTGDLDQWLGLLGEAAALTGAQVDRDELFRLLFTAALDAPADADGLLVYNYLSGEHQTGVATGRPMVVRPEGVGLVLAPFLRAQLNGAFAALAAGMRVLLRDEGVVCDEMFAHGGIFTTRGVAQQVLADALGVPVAVAESAGEGGAWGMAVLAGHAVARAQGDGTALADHLAQRIFADLELTTLAPDSEGQAGYARWLDRYLAALPVERLAGELIV